MHLILHNAAHDIPILAELFGVTSEELMTRITFDDTMAMSYVLRLIPQGLKPLERRYNGRKRQSYTEVTREADRVLATDYLRRILTFKCSTCNGDGTLIIEPIGARGVRLAPRPVTCEECEGDGTSWPPPDEYLEYVNGEVKIRRGQKIGTRVRRTLRKHLVSSGGGDGDGQLVDDSSNDEDDDGEIEEEASAGTGEDRKPTGLRKWWTKDIDYDYRVKIEDALGPMPEVTLDDVDQKVAVTYSCLSRDSLILTEDGPQSIGSIVRSEWAGCVWSVDSSGTRVLRPITNWYRVGGRRNQPDVTWLSVETSISRAGRWGGINVTRYTPDHKLYTERGWVEVQRLTTDDFIDTGISGLDSIEVQVVLGSLLGDGYLGKRNSTGWCQLVMTQAEKQLDYLKWKAGLFRTAKATVALSNVGGVGTFKGREVYRQSQWCAALESRPELTALRSTVYAGQKNEKVATADWVSGLDWLGLAIWYQDDGTLVGGKTARIYSLAFSPDSVQVLRDALLSNFGVETTAYDVAETVSRMFTQALHVRAVSSEKFFRGIAPYVHPCMRYKLPEQWRSIPFVEEPGRKFTGNVYARVQRVYSNPSNRRGNAKTSYCIDVEETHNFITAGGEVAHNCEDADGTMRIYPLLKQQLEAEGLMRIYEIDRDTIPLLVRMMEVGTYFDVPYARKLDARLEVECDQILYQLQQTVGHYVNPASPKQVAELLFDELNLPVVKETKTGQESTQDKVLEDLKLQVAAMADSKANRRALSVLNNITDYRERTKLRGTYTLALPRVVDKNSRIHTTFKSTRTDTNRLSSAYPNLQNIPARSDLGMLVRGAFAAPEGYSLVAVDLSQIEVRVMAHLCGDKNLIAGIKSGVDVHLITASHIFRTMIEKVTKKQRTIAKKITFLILYGGGAMRLRAELRLEGIEVTVEETQTYIDAYLKIAYPGIEDFMDEQCSKARRYGYVETLMGWRRYLPGVHSELDGVRMEAERMAVNAPVQGTAAEIMRMACPVLMNEVYPKVRKSGYDCDPLLTVHDEVVSQVRIGGEEKLAKKIVKAMTEVMELAVPILAEWKTADRWSLCK